MYKKTYACLLLINLLVGILNPATALAETTDCSASTDDCNNNASTQDDTAEIRECQREVAKKFDADDNQKPSDFIKQAMLISCRYFH